MMLYHSDVVDGSACTASRLALRRIFEAGRWGPLPTETLSANFPKSSAVKKKRARGSESEARRPPVNFFAVIWQS